MIIGERSWDVLILKNSALRLTGIWCFLYSMSASRGEGCCYNFGKGEELLPGLILLLLLLIHAISNPQSILCQTMQSLTNNRLRKKKEQCSKSTFSSWKHFHHHRRYSTSPSPIGISFWMAANVYLLPILQEGVGVRGRILMSWSWRKRGKNKKRSCLLEKA